MNKPLRTERDFLLLSVPATEEQQKELEESLRENGCIEPVITWNGVVIDGHKRYRFCMEEGIEFPVEEIDFPSSAEAISWVCRRRLNECKQPVPFRYLAGRLYWEQKTIYRMIRKQPDNERTVKLNPQYSRVSQYVGEELHINRATVEHYGAFALSMNEIAEKCPDLFDAIMKGKVILNASKTREIAKYDEQQLRDLCWKEWKIESKNDAKEKIRHRPRKKRAEKIKDGIELTVGIKEMPAYDPDMELRGLTLTIPTWIMAIRRLEDKTAHATDRAKAQLSRSLEELKNQADELIEVIAHG